MGVRGRLALAGVVGLTAIALGIGLVVRELVSTTAVGPPGGAMAVDCNGAIAGVQAVCTYPTIPTTFTVQVHATKAPPDGYLGFQSKTRWVDAIIEYLPASSAASEILWPGCQGGFAARSNNQPADPSVVNGCAAGIGAPPSNFTGAVVQISLRCDALGVTPLTLVPAAGDTQGGTQFIDPNQAPLDPALTNATVTCGTPPTATFTPVGPTNTPTPSRTPTNSPTPCPTGKVPFPGGCGTPTSTPTATNTRTPTNTPTITPTPTNTRTPTSTPTPCPPGKVPFPGGCGTPTPSPTATNTPTITNTPPATATPTETTAAGVAGVQLTISDATPTVGETITVTAAVVDSAGAPLAGVDCTFAIVALPAGSNASVAAGPVTTDSAGVATTTLSVGSTPGTIQVEATCGAFTGTVSVVAGAAVVSSPTTGAGPSALPSTGSGGGGDSALGALWLAVAGLAGLTMASGLYRRLRRLG